MCMFFCTVILFRYQKESKLGCVALVVKHIFIGGFSYHCVLQPMRSMAHVSVAALAMQQHTCQG